MILDKDKAHRSIPARIANIIENIPDAERVKEELLSDLQILFESERRLAEQEIG